ncbi:MAG: hypothetical protein B7X35_05490 [Halothiobacillus sp. 14-56-357]|jgi:hypothetical protein|nr:MAG: hypothetical protein B7X35_05490 [Halothiobacillus sp. 14-56-357]
MIDQNNPAGRLHKILTDALRKNEREQTRKVWASVFGIDENNETEIIRSLLSLQELVQEVHALIENNPQSNSGLLLKSFPNLRRAVSAQNLMNPWSSFRVGLDPETITRLEFCAEFLSGKYSEVSIPREEVEELKKLLSAMVEFAEKSTMPNELKAFVLNQLEELRRGVFDFNIKGACGLRTAMETVIGTTITQTAKYQEIKETYPDVLARMGQLLDRIDGAMSKALKIKKTLGNAAKLLGLSWVSGKDED